MDKKYALFYGSLKKDHYNFNRFGGQTFVKEVELDGYELFNLGSYPAILEGKGKIIAELHEVTPEAFASIRRMEIGAGYSEKQKEIDGEKASLFVFSESRIRNAFPKIEDGNWR